MKKGAESIVNLVVLGNTSWGKSVYKKRMTEADISTKFITLAIVEAGWNLHTQIKQEYFLPMEDC